MAIKCPKCNADNPETLKFCGECGTKLPSIKDIGVTKTIETPVREFIRGTTFADRYEIIEELGKGGMGVVYKAKDTRLNRFVALKFLPQELAYDKESRNRFVREAQAAAALSHPHICTIYEIDEEKGRSFITMEYIEGQSLRELIKIGPQSVKDVLDIAVQVAEGLDEAHKKGIVHRDIKSANIMLTANGQAKIMDFGLAKVSGGSMITQAAKIMGTIAYMSPEQTTGEIVDNRADIWSLGVVLYELATGVLPFRGDQDETILLSIRHDQPKPLMALASEAPRVLEQIIAKCLAKNPAHRYSNADELALDLRRLREGTEFTITTTAGVKAGPIQRIFSWRWPLYGVVTSVLAIVTVIAFFMFRPAQNKISEPELPRIAVALFENKTGDPALDLKGDEITLLIERGLYSTELVSVIEHNEMVSSEPNINPNMLARDKGAKKLISGAYFLRGQDLRFECKITDTSTGKIEQAIEPESGPVEDPFPAMVIVQERLMGGLAASLDTDFKLIRGGMPVPSYAAWKEYIEARRFEAKMEFKKAREHYHKAYELDNNFVYCRLREAFYFFAFVNDTEVDLQRANAILEEVNKKREKLTPGYRAFMDWMLANLGKDLEGCLRASKEMMRYSPVAQFQYAQDCLSLNRAQEAIEILNRPDTKPSVAGQDDFLWRVKTITYLKLDKRKKALESAHEASRLYPDRNSNLHNEIRALAALGRVKEINQRWEEHKNKKGMPRHMFLATQMLYFYGYEKAYSEVSNLVVDWHERRLEEEAEKPDFRHSYAFSLYSAGRWEEAKKIWKQLAQDYPDDRRFTVYLGLIAAWQGDRDEALRIENILENMNRTSYFRGCIAALLGEKDRALTLLKESLEEGGTWLYSFKAGMQMELKPLLDYPSFQEFVNPKD